MHKKNALLVISITYFLFSCKALKPAAVEPTLAVSQKSIDKKSIDVPSAGYTSINGETNKINGATVYIVGEDFKQKLWTDTIKDNEFSASIHLAAAGFYFIVFEGKYPKDSTATGWIHGLQIYLENGHQYQILAGSDWNILYNRVVVNSDSFTQNKLFKFESTSTAIDREIKRLEYEKSTLEKEISNGNRIQANKKLLATTTKKLALAKYALADLPINFTLENPNTIVSTYELLKVSDKNIKERYLVFKKAYDRLSTEIKNEKDGVKFGERLQKIYQSNNHDEKNYQ